MREEVTFARETHQQVWPKFLAVMEEVEVWI